MAGALPSDPIPNIGFNSYCGAKASLEVVPIAAFFGLESRPWQLAHRRAYYQVLWVQTEGMEVRIDQVTLLLKPGQLLFVGPHQALSVRSVGGAEGYVIRFLDVFLLDKAGKVIAPYDMNSQVEVVYQGIVLPGIPGLFLAWNGG
jgi:hypothetical protein